MDEFDQATIANYQVAYERRHGKKAPALLYRRGWFVFEDKPTTHYRRWQIVKMMKFLNEQAEQIESLTEQ